MSRPTHKLNIPIDKNVIPESNSLIQLILNIHPVKKLKQQQKQIVNNLKQE